MRKTPAIRPEFASFRLRIHRSRIHGWGVFAAQTIPRGRAVIEYTGERLTYRQAYARLRKNFADPRRRRICIFRLNWYWRIDGAVEGSGAEYINHSCSANLKARKIRGHLMFFSLRQIRPGEELTLDYHLPRQAFPIRCRCGAANCHGMVNYR